MVHVSSHAALQTLALDAELAGAAMACRYLCSDEYEAELIAERRATGVYSPARRYGYATLWGVLVLAVLLSIVMWI